MAKIFDSQLRLNLGVSFLVLSDDAMPLIFNSASLAFTYQLAGQSLG